MILVPERSEIDLFSRKECGGIRIFDTYSTIGFAIVIWWTYQLTPVDKELISGIPEESLVVRCDRMRHKWCTGKLASCDLGTHWVLDTIREGIAFFKVSKNKVIFFIHSWLYESRSCITIRVDK